MAIVKPFAAVYYNPEKVSDLSKVVCPPYDVISPDRQAYYHDLDPRNFIHILLGKDAPQEDKYERSGKTERQSDQNNYRIDIAVELGRKHHICHNDTKYQRKYQALERFF